jgi:acetyltransferase-like isoleucine patch superfamily enzyme
MTNNRGGITNDPQARVATQRAPIEACGRQHGSAGDSKAASFVDHLCRYFHRKWLPRYERYRALPRNFLYSRLLQVESISLGAGCRIRGLSRLHIGRAFKALDNLWLEAVERDRAGNLYNPSLIIGNDVVFGYGVHLAATNRVHIGNDVLVGSHVIITDHNHGTYKGVEQTSPFERPANRLLTSDAETVVEDNVWIGDGAVILPGAHIGMGSVIGANSIVNGIIPRHSMAAGTPARPIKVYDGESKTWVPVDNASSSSSEQPSRHLP